MGHLDRWPPVSSSSDRRAVNFLARLLRRIGKIIWRLKGKPGPGIRPFRRAKNPILAPSFEAETEVLFDQASENFGMCVRLSVHPRLVLDERVTRYLYFRLEHSKHRLTQPRAWRRALYGLQPDRSSDDLPVWRGSRDLYWAPEAPTIDLEVQLIIALTQLGALPSDTPLHEYLIQYVLDNFRLYSSSSAERQCVARLVVERLLTNWSDPEDWKALRKYIAISARSVQREIPKSEPGARTDENGLSEDELFNETDEQKCKPKKGRPSHAWQGEQWLTAWEAANLLEVSRWYVYDLVRAGKLNRRSGSEILIDASQLEEVRNVLSKRRRLRRLKLRRMEDQRGKTSEAARKWVYRKFGAAPKIPGKKEGED